MPTPSSYSTNSMPTYKGVAPGLDSNGMISNMAWYPRIVAKTAAYSPKATESGTFFTTTGATADVTFTLPVLVSGTSWIFDFYCGADYEMLVAAGTADTAVTFNDLAADSVAFTTASEQIGGHIRAFTNGTTLFIIPSLASEAQTVTIATA